MIYKSSNAMLYQPKRKCCIRNFPLCVFFCCFILLKKFCFSSIFLFISIQANNNTTSSKRLKTWNNNDANVNICNIFNLKSVFLLSCLFGYTSTSEPISYHIMLCECVRAPVCSYVLLGTLCCTYIYQWPIWMWWYKNKCPWIKWYPCSFLFCRFYFGCFDLSIYWSVARSDSDSAAIVIVVTHSYHTLE